MYVGPLAGTIFLCNCGLSSSAFLSIFFGMLEVYLFVNDSTDSGWERLWTFEWHYVNAQ